ncbi:M48 family metalloprotease [Rhodomicrobium udaipurense]|uniref:M48 family metallopeptidase n=1 Tax=Rhodomicrobium udaipurense TaxID=1202716 RepID=A0A8I1GH23_9HYPH|nr:M48 family metalloprotease [Rhodomicrobium udaipurense]MBJ7542827.1 M48 family metallopeptidase [Rhodomicrobium udaipurense]
MALSQTISRLRKLAACVAIFATATTAPASAQEISLIRDAETEALIADYTAPIFRAAGVSGNNIKVHLVNDGSFNAFVVDGRNMFINTGAILQSETPNQIIGVIAHETGHIKGGHITGLRQQIAKMQTAALMLQVLSIGTMVGGAASGSSEAMQGGSAMMMGGSQVLMRSILSYRRAQESAADQAGVEYLNKSQQSPAGMLKTFRYFANQSLGNTRVDPYIQTHPVPADRIAQLEEIAKKSPYFDQKDSAQLQLRHDLVRAKIAAYTWKNNPQAIARRYNDNGLPARYARAIMKYHMGGYPSAAPALEELIAQQPQNPWFHELKGTFLLESGRAKEAVAPFRKAVSLVSKSGFMRIELAQAILESGGGSAEEALQLLRVGMVEEEQSYLGYRLQAQAYGKLRRFPEADLASALAAFHKGDVKVAKMMAERAKNGLAAGSPGWVKADDIVNFKMEKVRG